MYRRGLQLPAAGAAAAAGAAIMGIPMGMLCCVMRWVGWGEIGVSKGDIVGWGTTLCDKRLDKTQMVDGKL